MAEMTIKHRTYQAKSAASLLFLLLTELIDGYLLYLGDSFITLTFFN